MPARADGADVAIPAGGKAAFVSPFALKRRHTSLDCPRPRSTGGRPGKAGVCDALGHNAVEWNSLRQCRHLRSAFALPANVSLYQFDPSLGI